MTKIQLRHDTAANFTSVNPVLLEGEMAIETDTNKAKIGDGTTAYNSLEYFGGDIDLSNYYNKTETDGLLDEKISKDNIVSPIEYSELTQTNAGITVSGSTFTAAGPLAGGDPPAIYNSGYKLRCYTLGGRSYLSASQFSFVKDDLKGLTIYHGACNPLYSYKYPYIFIGKLASDRKFTPIIYVGGFTNANSFSQSRGWMCKLPDTPNSIVYSDGYPYTTYTYDAITAQNIQSSYSYASASDYIRAKIVSVNGTIHIYGYYNSNSADLNTGIAEDDFDCNCVVFGYSGSSTAVYQLANTKVVDDASSQIIWQPGDNSSIGGLGLNIGTGLTVQNGALVNTNPTAYNLPVATTSTLGGVIPDGTTVTIDSNGVISSAGSSVTVDQTYDDTSTNAQSGVAIAGAGFALLNPGTFGTQNFYSTQIFNGGINTQYIKNLTGSQNVISVSTSTVNLNTASVTTTRNNMTYNILDTDTGADINLSNVPASKGILIDSYVNGTSWYRVYSDGWCEQGGLSAATSVSGFTITLLKEYLDTNYTQMLCLYTSQVGSWYESQVTSKTTTSFNVANNNNTSRQISWQTSGYIDMSQYNS